MHYCIIFSTESKLQMVMQSPIALPLVPVSQTAWWLLSHPPVSSPMGVTEVSYVNHSSDRLQANAFT